MNICRYGLLAVCGAVLVRFLATPTPQCTLALLGALAVVGWMECTRRDYLQSLYFEVKWAKDNYKSEAEANREVMRTLARDVVNGATEVTAALRKDLDETRAKVDNLSSRRAFGG